MLHDYVHCVRGIVSCDVLPWRQDGRAQPDAELVASVGQDTLTRQQRSEYSAAPQVRIVIVLIIIIIITIIVIIIIIILITLITTIIIIIIIILITVISILI